MPYEVLLHIHEDSERGRVIQTMARAQHVTPEQVIEQLIDDACIRALPLRAYETVNVKTPAEMLLGLFSSPEDADLIDSVTAIAYEGRAAVSTRDIGL